MYTRIDALRTKYGMIGMFAVVAAFVAGICLGIWLVQSGFTDKPEEAIASVPEAKAILADSQLNFDAEYRSAAQEIAIPYDANSNRSRLSAAQCYERLAAGMPVGTISDLRIAKAILTWGRSLGTVARLAYAARCLDSASDICSGHQPRPKVLLRLIGPLPLYATAWNLTYDRKIAALFYTESDRQHEIALAKHTGKVAQVPGPPCVYPVNPTIGAKYSQPLADTPPPAPRRHLLYNWRQLHRRPLTAVPDPR